MGSLIRVTKPISKSRLDRELLNMIIFPWDAHLISLESQTLNCLTIAFFHHFLSHSELPSRFHKTFTFSPHSLGRNTSSAILLLAVSCQTPRSWRLTQCLPRQSSSLFCLPSHDRTFGLHLSLAIIYSISVSFLSKCLSPRGFFTIKSGNKNPKREQYFLKYATVHTRRSGNNFMSWSQSKKENTLEKDLQIEYLR